MIWYVGSLRIVMQVKIAKKPQFSSRIWLSIGVLVGVVLIAQSFYPSFWGKLFVIGIGLVLSIHCLEMMRYWKHHSVVYNGNISVARATLKGKLWFWRRITCWTNSIRFAWRETSFKVGVILCTLGIAIGLVVGVGMTELVLLVAIACLGWGLEIANTSIETLCDIVHPDYSSKVKKVKDSFSAIPIFTYTAYTICWLILVVPTLWGKLI